MSDFNSTTSTNIGYSYRTCNCWGGCGGCTHWVQPATTTTFAFSTCDYCSSSTKHTVFNCPRVKSVKFCVFGPADTDGDNRTIEEIVFHDQV